MCNFPLISNLFLNNNKRIIGNFTVILNQWETYIIKKRIFFLSKVPSIQPIISKLIFNFEFNWFKNKVTSFLLNPTIKPTNLREFRTTIAKGNNIFAIDSKLQISIWVQPSTFIKYQISDINYSILSIRYLVANIKYQAKSIRLQVPHCRY